MVRQYGGGDDTLPWEDSLPPLQRIIAKQATRGDATSGIQGAIRGAISGNPGRANARGRQQVSMPGREGPSPQAGIGSKISSLLGNLQSGPRNNMGAVANVGALTMRRQKQMAGDMANLLARQEAGDAAATNDIFGKTLQDYLNQAGDGSDMIAGEMSQLSAREQALKKQAGMSDEALQQMYAQLQNSIGQAATETGTRYADAGKQAQTLQQQTTGQIQAANDQSRSAQAEIAKNLGMEDVKPSMADNGQAVDNSSALSETAVRGQSQQDLLQTTGQSQQDFFKGNQVAAGYRGAEQRAGLQGDLNNRLAEIMSERSGLSSQAKQQAMQMAIAQYEADYGQFNDQRQYNDSRDDLAYERAFGERQYGDSLSQQRSQMELERQQMAMQNQPETPAAPAFAQIKQALLQYMPDDQANAALSAMNQARSQGVPIQDVLRRSNLTPGQKSIAEQWAAEYFNSYKF